MNLQVFNNPHFGAIRTIANENNEPFFVARDICSVLGYSKPENAVSQHVDEDDTLKQGITDNLGRIQQTTVINESGVYALIFGSRLPQAKQFKKWVTSEVLPSIRKNVGYIHANEDESDDAIFEKALFIAQKKIQEREARIHMQQEQIRLQENEIKTIAPKAEYCDKVLTSTSIYRTEQIARELDMTAQTLNKKLKEKGVILKVSVSAIRHH